LKGVRLLRLVLAVRLRRRGGRQSPAPCADDRFRPRAYHTMAPSHPVLGLGGGRATGVHLPEHRLILTHTPRPVRCAICTNCVSYREGICTRARAHTHTHTHTLPSKIRHTYAVRILQGGCQQVHDWAPAQPATDKLPMTHSHDPGPSTRCVRCGCLLRLISLDPPLLYGRHCRKNSTRWARMIS
jgi:hypothetical protein